MDKEQINRELGFLAQRIRHEILEPKKKEQMLDHVRKILKLMEE